MKLPMFLQKFGAATHPGILAFWVLRHFFQSMIFPFTMGGDMLLYSPGGFLNVLLCLGFYQRCTVFGA